jgi:hypothetical protein
MAELAKYTDHEAATAKPALIEPVSASVLSALNLTFDEVIDTEAEPALIGVTVTVAKSERPSEEYTTTVNA